MAERQQLRRLLAKNLSGKEIARLALQSYIDEQGGGKPAFTLAEVERARASLRGRPQEAAVYNAWMEAIRIVDAVSMDALVKALATEKRLVWVISSVTHLLRQGSIRCARRMSTKILTPAEWAAFPAAREKARRALMAEETFSFDQVVRNRAWWMAPADLKAKVGACPHAEDEGGNAYDLLVEADEAAARKLYMDAMAEIGALINTRKLRFVCDGRNVSAKLKAKRRSGPAHNEAVALAAEAECTLLELVDAGLPEWMEWGRAEHFTPIEFQGPVAVLQEAPPECLDENGQILEPGWRGVEDALRREITPAKLDTLHQVVASCRSILRVFLRCKAIIALFSRELGLDLSPPPLREEEEALRGMLAIYNQLVEISRDGEPEEDGFVPADWVLQLPRNLRLPLIDLEELEPDPEAVENMGQCLATPCGEAWWEAAIELGLCGTNEDADLEHKERLR